MSTPNTITVNILDKEYQVACPEEQQAELIVSAKYLDKQMRTIRDTGKVIGLERIAVIAGLNLSHELLEATHSAADKQVEKESLQSLTEKLDQALESFS